MIESADRSLSRSRIIERGYITVNTLLIALGIFVALSFAASVLILSALVLSSRAGSILEEPELSPIAVVGDTRSEERDPRHETAIA